MTFGWKRSGHQLGVSRGGDREAHAHSGWSLNCVCRSRRHLEWRCGRTEVDVLYVAKRSSETVRKAYLPLLDVREVSLLPAPAWDLRARLTVRGTPEFAASRGPLPGTTLAWLLCISWGRAVGDRIHRAGHLPASRAVRRCLADFVFGSPHCPRP